jgi:hypothetical protein
MKIPAKAILLAVVLIIAVGITGTILSPTNAITIIGFCGLAIPSLLSLLKSGEAAEKVAEAAVKVDEVKTSLAASNFANEAQLNKIEATGEKTHTLVNSNMGVQLKLNAVSTRRLAVLTKDAVDEAAANLAEQTLKEHEGKQAIVDSGRSTNGPS